MWLMDVSCDLEVDVNGEEIFLVNKEVISFYSGKIGKLLGKSRGVTRNIKVIFQDFPGGAEGLELMTRFCYNNGKIEINPLNVSLLFCIAHFMEMNKSVSGTHNLIELTEKSMERIRYWTWSELLVTLKHCQDLLPIADTSGLLAKCLDSLVGRLAFASETSPCPSASSSDSSGVRMSCESRSTESLKHSFFRATWWFEDLVFFNLDLVKMVIKSMELQKFDHSLISRFLLYYQKSRFLTASTEEKQEIFEAVIEMLHSLDWRAVSCKSLFGILRVAQNLNISKCCRNKLENMIGSQLDHATLDNLLVPSPTGANYLFDVNLVLRFLKSFRGRGICCAPLTRLKKVSGLMDLYITEVAPDPCLRPSKFLTLVRALPESARDTYDRIYHAMDMYLEVHIGLSDEEKLKICCGLNYGKLSLEACNHLAQNPKFPQKSAVQALISQQCRLKSLLQDPNQEKPFIDSPYSFAETENEEKKDETCEQVVLYAGKPDLSSENQKLRAHLQGMQWRVLELEKLCRKMQTQMAKLMKSRLSSHSNGRSVPRLCS